MCEPIDLFSKAAALISFMLFCYCAWRLRQIDRRIAAISRLLSRDYEEDLSSRGMNRL